MENKDEILTAMFRDRIQNMKNDSETSAKEGAATFIITAFLALMKWASLTFITWLGWRVLSNSFAAPALSFLDTFLVLAAVRSFSMLIISPLISKKNKD